MSAVCLPHSDLVESFGNTSGFSQNDVLKTEETLAQTVVIFGEISTENVFDDSIAFFTPSVFQRNFPLRICMQFRIEWGKKEYLRLN